MAVTIPQHLPPLLSHADIHLGARCSAVLAHCMYMQPRWCTFVGRFFRLLTIGIFHCVSENVFLKDVFIEKPTHMFTHRYMFADFPAWTGQSWKLSDTADHGPARRDRWTKAGSVRHTPVALRKPRGEHAPLCLHLSVNIL